MYVPYLEKGPVVEMTTRVRFTILCRLLTSEESAMIIDNCSVNVTSYVASSFLSSCKMLRRRPAIAHFNGPFLPVPYVLARYTAANLPVKPIV